MEVLSAMKAEFKEIVNDIKLHPDHLHIYDLVGLYEEIRKEENKQLSVVETARIMNLSLKEVYDLIECGKLNVINNKHIVILKGDLYSYKMQ